MRRALTCVLLAGVSPVLAQENDTIVVTATRVAQPVEQAPATITVLTQAYLQQQGAVSLADAFAAVPGLNIVQSGPAGQPASLFVRGADSDLVLVMRDGVPVNDGSSPAGAFDFGEDLANDIGRIEILRGPDSGLYGSAAIGGVVAISTPQGSAKPVAEIGALAGSAATLWGSADASGVVGKFDYAVGGVSGSTAGFDSTPQRMTYYAGHRDGERATQGYANFGYSPLPLTRVSLILRGRTTTEGYNEIGFDTDQATARLNNNFARAAVDSTLLNGEWQTSLAISENHDDRNYVQLAEAADPDYFSEIAHYRADSQLLQWNNKLGLGNGALDFGGEYGAQTVAVALNEPSYYYTETVNARRNNGSFYAGAVQSWQRLTGSINVREDGNTGETGAFTWRAGAVLAIPEVFSHLRVSYGTGYKAPSLYDLYGVDNYGYVGNPALRPETSQGIEIGWRTDWKALSLDVAAFDQKIHNLIEEVYNSSYTAATSENVARSQIDGFEGTITGRFAANSDVQLSYTHLDPRDQTDHTLLLRRPRNRLSALAHLRWQQFTLVPEVTYTGKSYDYIYDNSGNYGEGFGQTGTVTNLTLSYDVNQHLSLQLLGKNIFDSRWEAANGYQIGGAQILAGVKAKF